MEADARALIESLVNKVQSLKAQVAALEVERREPIAIIGIGCRFPGGASTPAAFWDLLDRGVDAVRPLDERWAMLGASGGGVRWAGLLTEPIDAFDAAFFGISPREARALDPQQRLLLEVAWEAIEDAGMAPSALEGSRTGVFVGGCHSDYAQIVGRQPPEEIDVYSGTGNAPCMAAGRVAYTLGLHGPALTLDTACSSSIVTVHLACQSLRSRESDLALAAGVGVLLSADTMERTEQTLALSPDGRCKSFDSLANGMVRGEGCGIVLLKRLSEARRDGDRIWGIVRGSAVNQDGRSSGLTAPNVRAEETVIRDAHRAAGVAPAAIDFVETHGTGTALGDPIEAEALRAVMGAPRPDGSRCLLGAVKTNIGHLEGAAGVAALVKAVLALHHERIPRNLHFRALNPRVRLQGTPLAVASEPVAWPRGPRPRFAGVSAFGMSGTNAHLVLEEVPPAPPAAPTPPRSFELAVLSGRDDAAVNAQASRLHAHLAGADEADLRDVAFSLATTRSALDARVAVAAGTLAGLRAALDEVARGEAPAGSSRGRRRLEGAGKVVFVFSGRGAEWTGMGRGLLAEEEVFRSTMESVSAAIEHEAGWSVLAELGAPADASRLARVDVLEPSMFAVQVALAALWASWGIRPDVVVGHGVGEVAAAYVAGALTLEDAAAVIVRRSRLLERLGGRGGAVAVVERTLQETERAIAGREDRLRVAATDGPRTTAIAGEASALSEVLAKLESEGIFCRRLAAGAAGVGVPSDALLRELKEALAPVKAQAARVAMRSTIRGGPIGGQELAAPYWVDHLRRPVRFLETIQGLLRDVAPQGATEGTCTFVEIGPHPVLLPAIEEIGRASAVAAGAAPGADGLSPWRSVGSLRRDQPERGALLESLGALWSNGFAVEWSRVFGAGRRVPLPTYAWQRERHWIDALPALREGAPPKDGAADSHEERDRLLERLSAASPEERRALLEGTLAAHVARVLRVPPDKLDVQAPLAAQGMDSIMGLELRGRIERSLGITVPAALARTYPTIPAIGGWLLGQLFPSHRGERRSIAGAVRFREVRAPRARAFCFHGAGGSPELFAGWGEILPHDFDVLGMWNMRDRSDREPPFQQYLDEIVAIVAAEAAAPLFLVGMSLGGAFAWRVACELARRSPAQTPNAVYIVGSPLHEPSITLKAERLDYLTRLYDRRIAGYHRAMEQVEADIDADLRLASAMGFPSSTGEPLPIPIVAFGGDQDAVVSPEELRAWGSRTTAAFVPHFFPGDHHFMIEGSAEIVRMIGGHFEGLLARADGGRLGRSESALSVGE